VNAVLVISERDNVGTALEPLEAGCTIRVASTALTLIDAIPRGHKVALRAIGGGDAVVKYGSVIGTATSAIPAGAHVHTHNLASARGRGDLGGAVGPQSDPAVLARIAEPPDPA
jgi:altronate dehydratase